MNQDGFTLAEALAALLIIGLALGGLTEGVRVIGRLQTGAARDIASTRGARAADLALGRLFKGQGPFRSDDPHGFDGDRTAFSFDCDAAQVCGAKLQSAADGDRLIVTHPDRSAVTINLPGLRDAHFEYEDASGATEAWPTGDKPQVLRRVRIMGADRRGSGPVATARLWLEQPADCEFDSITRDCRRRKP